MVAFAEEIGSTLLKRTVLGDRLVMFRRRVELRSDCKIVVLIAPIRSRPECLMETPSYAAITACGTTRPEIASRSPRRSTVRRHGVRTFPLIERGPLVWGWFGEPSKADSDMIPSTPWLENGEWASSSGLF